MKKLHPAILIVALSLVSASGSAAPKNVDLAFDMITSGSRAPGVLECRAHGTGGSVSSISITLCQVTFADGAVFSAPKVTVPANFAITAKTFIHENADSRICIGGIARFRDSTSVSKTICYV